jgi:glycine cleavage system H protein
MMAETRYTKDHEYARLEGDVAIIGITDYAQHQLGDVVYVDLPELGRTLKKGDEAAVVESVKAASEVYAPLSGEVIAINSALEDAPGTINEDPAGEGWFLKIRVSNRDEFPELMESAAYESYLKTIA